MLNTVSRRYFPLIDGYNIDLRYFADYKLQAGIAPVTE